jgi:hypothetical protein
LTLPVVALAMLAMLAWLVLSVAVLAMPLALGFVL